MPKVIGVCASGQEAKIGSLFVAIIVIDNNNFFRTRSKLVTKKNLTPEEKYKLFKETKDHLWFDVVKMPPSALKGKDLKTIEAELIVEALNRRPKFWEDKINIAFSDKAILIDNMDAYLPHNLKIIRKKLKCEKWKILKNPFKLKVLALAKHYSLWMRDKELEEIKQVWGDLSNADEFIKNNTDCPHLR